MKYLEKIELRPPVLWFCAAIYAEYRLSDSELRGKIARKIGETVYTPTPARDVPMMMLELVDWLNRAEETHPVLVSGVAQFNSCISYKRLKGNPGRKKAPYLV
jgi:hypothetical protein